MLYKMARQAAELAARPAALHAGKHTEMAGCNPAAGQQPSGTLRRVAFGVVLGLIGSAAWAGIYTCVDSKGNRLTADRPIAACTTKEQQVLNNDGSVRAVVPPTLTAEEKMARDARERAATEQRLAQQDAARRDRNLVMRYPDEAAHQRAREAALDTVRLAVKATESRLKDLALQRKPLLSETEFYQGKPMPPKLKAALDANDAALEAQKSAVAGQAAEKGRINKIYDVELERLRRLWAGAAPGTLGVLNASGALSNAGPSKITP